MTQEKKETPKEEAPKQMQVMALPTELFVEVVQLIEEMQIRQGYKVYQRLMALRPITMEIEE